MRARALLVAALLAGVVAGGVRGAVAAEVARPAVGVGSCELDVTNGDAECVVALLPDPSGLFLQSTWSGYGTASLYCFGSGRTFHLGGEYGTSWEEWDHGADVCRLSLRAVGGRSTAWVD